MSKIKNPLGKYSRCGRRMGKKMWRGQPLKSK